MMMVIKPAVSVLSNFFFWFWLKVNYLNKIKSWFTSTPPFAELETFEVEVNPVIGNWFKSDHFLTQRVYSPKMIISSLQLLLPLNWILDFLFLPIFNLVCLQDIFSSFYLQTFGFHLQPNLGLLSSISTIYKSCFIINGLDALPFSSQAQKTSWSPPNSWSISDTEPENSTWSQEPHSSPSPSIPLSREEQREF